MENEKKGNYNPEDRNSEARQAGTNRDNSIVNAPNHADESGTSPSRNDDHTEQYHAGHTDRLTGTSSVSDSRAAEGTRESMRGAGKNTNQDEVENEALQTGQNQYNSEHSDDESDDFLKGSGLDYDADKQAIRHNSLDPDFDRNAEV